MLKCEVIEDLIPLVKDGVASRESERLVMEHIQTCENCRKEYESTNTSTNSQKNGLKDEFIVKKIKQRVFLLQSTVLVAGAILGGALTGTMGMFYNILIMPILGVLCYFALKQSWYLGVSGIFILSYLYQIVKESIVEGFKLEWLMGAALYSGIYLAFILAGVIIGGLLHYAIKGRWT